MIRRLTMISCGVLSAWLGAGCTDSHEESDAEAEAATVIVAPVEKASFTDVVRGTGVCEPLPNLLAMVCPAVDGVVVEVLVAQGDEVDAGRPLVRLDARLAALDLVEKQAAKAELEASLVLLKAPPRDPDRRAAELDVERAKAAADLAGAVVRKLEPLNQRQEISDQQLLESKRKLDDAELAAKTAQARLELVLAGARPEAIAEAEAKVARATAAVDQARTRLEYSTLTSPRRGTVDAIHCHPGQVLTPGTVAVEVIDASSIIASVSVPPAEAAKLKPGQTARVTTVWPGSGCEGRPDALPGKVASVGLQASAATGSLPVRVLIANTGGALRANMVVQVEITVGEVANVLAVPDAAILIGDEGPSIAIVRSDKAVRLHPRIGLRQGGLVQVTAEGLAVGDLVITRCAHDLADGAEVKVKEEHEEPAAAAGGTQPQAAREREEAKR